MSSTSAKYEFADCAALYDEATQSGDPTRLCPPADRQNATVGTTIALAVQHPQYDDTTHLIYATITHRNTHNTANNITATILHPHRIKHPPHLTAAYHDAITSDEAHWCTLREGDTVHCQAKHIAWVVPASDVREPVGWEERRLSMLAAIRESDSRERAFDAARDECAFEKGSQVRVDAKLLKEEKKEREEERQQEKQGGKNKKAATKEAIDDVFAYDL